MKIKTSLETNTALQKQATEEQLRVAKLSQINNREDLHIQKIKEVSEITRKPQDVVSVALHDCNYDTSLAIQNIFEGKYDETEDEWQTTATKKGRKPPGSTTTSSTNHVGVSNDQNENLDPFDDSDEKPSNIKTNISRGGGTSSQRSRSRGRPKQTEDSFNTSEEKWETAPEKGIKSSRSVESGRGRGRGRGASRTVGNRGGGSGRGGRGGFGRGGGGGSFRGSNRSRGAGRGGFNTRGGFGRRPPRESRPKENGFGAPDDIKYSGGFGGAPSNENTDGWGLDTEIPKTESWGDDDIQESDNVQTADWSRDSWDEEAGTAADPTSTSRGVDSLFTRHKMNWSQMNGVKDNPDTWEGDEKGASTKTEKYLPEQVDAAVIVSIPTSATSAEVTSYQPTNDMSRYINSSASNQFPSSQQAGGLTNSLNDREFSLTSGGLSVESMKQTMSTAGSMPMVSGITESHKLEQEQLRAPSKTPPSFPMPAITSAQKSRKNLPKNTLMPSEPVVMPRSAQMVQDDTDQFVGLEFGSGPVSPRVTKTSKPTSTSDTMNPSKRQPVASLETTVVSASSVAPPIDVSISNDAIRQNSVSPVTLKPLDQPDVNAHYIGSPNRSLGHGMAGEPIPFPSSTQLSSPTSSSSLNVFSRHSGLGTSLTNSIPEQQKQQQSAQSLTSVAGYRDKQVYDAHDSNVNAGKILSEQKALAEKQYLVEQQRVLAEQQREQTMTEQRAFAEQKALAQQKLLANQRSTEDINSRNEPKPNSMSDTRKSLNEQRLGLAESQPGSSTKDKPKIASTETTYSTKSHRVTNPRSISSPPGLSSSVYTSNVSKSNDLLNQASIPTSSVKVSSSKVSGAPPGMIHSNLLYTAGVQPGILPTYPHQVHGYNYDEILQLQRLQLSQSPYHYDVSAMYPPNANAAATAARDGLPSYPSDSKFQRGNEESTAATLHQGNHPHVAASNMNPHQAYLNAGQIPPYGFAYTFQPGVMPQAGIYPTFTTPNVFQLNQPNKGVVGTQYQSQYASQQGFNAGKYSGAGTHDFSKGNFHSSGSAQTTLGAVKANQQNNINNSGGENASVQGGAGQYKGQVYNDAKSFLAASPSSMASQPTMALHGQTAHMGNINPYLLQQQQQQHNSLLTGQVSASQLGHQGSLDNRNTGHQVAFSVNQQQKRDPNKASYHSYWSGNR